MKLYLKNIVQDTYTNAAGYALLSVLKKYIEEDKKVILSFEGATPPSSSFLNSSIGELLDEIGFHKLKSLIRFVDLTPTQAQTLKNYFQSCDCSS